MQAAMSSRRIVPPCLKRVGFPPPKTMLPSEEPVAVCSSPFCVNTKSLQVTALRKPIFAKESVTLGSAPSPRANALRDIWPIKPNMRHKRGKAGLHVCSCTTEGSWTILTLCSWGACWWERDCHLSNNSHGSGQQTFSRELPVSFHDCWTQGSLPSMAWRTDPQKGGRSIPLFGRGHVESLGGKQRRNLEKTTICGVPFWIPRGANCLNMIGPFSLSPFNKKRRLPVFARPLATGKTKLGWYIRGAGELKSRSCLSILLVSRSGDLRLPLPRDDMICWAASVGGLALGRLS